MFDQGFYVCMYAVAVVLRKMNAISWILTVFVVGKIAVRRTVVIAHIRVHIVCLDLAQDSISYCELCVTWIVIHMVLCLKGGSR